MVQEYFRRVKKFVSRKGALDKLKLNSKQFDELCVLLTVYPVVAENKISVDPTPGWFYTINDVKKIYYSEAYNTIKINEGRAKKREKFINFKQNERAERVVDEEMSLIPLVKSRYSCFGKSLCDLGTSLRGLYFIDLFKIEDVKETLEEFENYVLENKLLKGAFLAKKGVYYKMIFEGKIVMWMVPYPGNNLEDLMEEKKLIEKKTKFTGHFDFESSEEFEEEESEEVDLNDSEKLDCSLLKYSSPLFEIHVKVVINKLKLLYKDAPIRKEGLFSNKKFFIDIKSITKEIEFVIKNEFGEIVSDQNIADIVIGESVDVIREDCEYLQPQYIFDCLNQSKLVDSTLYRIGKILPKHISPFPDVLEAVDPKILKTLSNRKRNMLLDKVQKLE